MKNKIFISHATPEDNLFALWLASRLSVLGYSVWIELKNLGGGEDSWRTIEKVIKEESAKFIFVISNKSIKKQGVLNELGVADRQKIQNFIVPVKIDDVPLRDFPTEIVRINYLDFSISWKDGLATLLKTFEDENVPKNKTVDHRTISTLESALNFNINRLIKNKHELYRSNWFEFKLPEKIYSYQLGILGQVNFENIPYEHKVENNLVISMACPECMKEFLNFAQFEEITTNDFISEKEFYFPRLQATVKETGRKVVGFLNQHLNNFLLSKELSKYQLANGDCYYLPWRASDELSYPKISLKKFGRRTIQIVGKDLDVNWHFAIEGNAYLNPVNAYGISYHVVFTKDGLPIDKNKQHTRRRRVGTKWYNKKWRDLLLGFMLWLSEDGDEKIKIPVCKHVFVELSTEPISLKSHVGYIEPEKKSVQDDNE